MCGLTDRVATRLVRGRDEQGVALITALALLVLFSLMGGAYVGYMLRDRDGVAVALQKSYVRHAAEAGIYAAIGELQRQVDAGVNTPSTIPYAFPLYRIQDDTLAPRDDAKLTTTVTVDDENARINVNFAPRGMLERILNVDRATARRITSELPHAGEAGNDAQRWFTTVDELVTRGYLTREAFEQLDTDSITVYTGEDMNDPRQYINLNTAPANVVAAVLNIPEERARAIAQGPPLTTLADLASAAGQDASAFNTISVPNALPNALPSELMLQSRSFRLISEARLSIDGASPKTARVEAVVLFRHDGTPDIRYWSVEKYDVDSEGRTVESTTPSDTAGTPDAAMPDAVPATPSEPQPNSRRHGAT